MCPQQRPAGRVQVGFDAPKDVVGVLSGGRRGELRKRHGLADVVNQTHDISKRRSRACSSMAFRAVLYWLLLVALRWMSFRAQSDS